MRYVLNSAVITTPGKYTYRLISNEEIKEWLMRGPFESTLGYQETATALSVLTGIPIGVNRRMVQFRVGDEALVFRLTCRLDDPRLKGYVGEDFILDHCEAGILRKEAD
ncbi:MAG TPA: DUF1874 domain-containing protein [Methanoregulaceae archaeon]|nr:DUF1874 domain-containing protein [Methanothrix sp.]HOL44681.1 DUF1874 domain-containing protein [Methanothrix sp.]HON93689.1 DUF1874 domain-containing protein [Sedimentisphaerales bacterium]HPD11579.1 DUF1874 domain-containing protein [Methanoregulaceae archaeon]HRT52159.1 DUF1874 domain-containing protein [Anaerohalosphaeraceae bacterium]